MPVSTLERRAGAARPSAPGFAVYVHWPFCQSKCPYCDFNSHVRADVDQDRWRAALVRELEYFADRVPARPVGSIFFGGGTPALMPPATVAAIVDTIAAIWPLAADVEISLEANPTSAEADRFTAFRDAGVNRLSLGVQSFDDDVLRFLGRNHDAATASTALALAERTFDEYSFDLIYALPGQDADAWRRALDTALRRAGNHISLYQLTIEDGTGFAGAVRRGAWRPLDDDDQADLFALTQQMTAAHNLPAYEISNHARPGHECRHNLTYWRYGEYVGIGPGAHGRVSIDGAAHATAQIRKPEAWLAAVEGRGHGTAVLEPLTAAARASECLMMGLRLKEGLSLATFEHAAGASLSDVVDPDRLAILLDDGFLRLVDDRLVASQRAWPVLNAVLAELLACAA